MNRDCGNYNGICKTKPDEPVRVLHVVTYMKRSGLETMIMNYYRHIDRRKIQFDFLEHRFERSDFDDEIESLGGRIYRMPPINPISLKYRKMLDDFFSEHKEYRIVHCHMNCMSSIPLYYAKKNNVDVRIAHSHTSNQKHDLKYPIRIFYRSRIPSVATDLFACGEEAGKWMYGGKKYRIVRNAVDMNAMHFDGEARNRIRNNLAITADNIIVGHIGRFCEMKNHEFLVEVFREVLKLNNEARLVLVGDGPGLNKIKRKVENIGIKNRVVFYGISENISEVLSAIDVFVLPSIYEGVPMTLVEARASGLRCIISDTVAAEEKVLIGGVKRLSLAEPPAIWAKEIVKASATYARHPINKIFEKEYGIAFQAQMLQDFYLSRCCSGLFKESRNMQ